MGWEERITLDPEVLTGKPVVKGTRLAVEFILQVMADGWTEEQVLDSYPGLTREDIRACLAHAVAALKAGNPVAVGGNASGGRGGDGPGQGKSLEQLAEEQGVRPIERLEDVLGEGADLWDSDEDFESFLQGIMERRRDGEAS